MIIRVQAILVCWEADEAVKKKATKQHRFRKDARVVCGTVYQVEEESKLFGGLLYIPMSTWDMRFHIPDWPCPKQKS